MTKQHVVRRAHKVDESSDAIEIDAAKRRDLFEAAREAYLIWFSARMGDWIVFIRKLKGHGRPLSSYYDVLSGICADALHHRDMRADFVEPVTRARDHYAALSQLELRKELAQQSQGGKT